MDARMCHVVWITRPFCTTPTDTGIQKTYALIYDSKTANAKLGVYNKI